MFVLIALISLTREQSAADRTQVPRIGPAEPAHDQEHLDPVDRLHQRDRLCRDAALAEGHPERRKRYPQHHQQHHYFHIATDLVVLVKFSVSGLARPAALVGILELICIC